jgi:hypothetical protein
MKALGYFAVVTGKGLNTVSTTQLDCIFLGNADDPIDLIQKYEDDFFRNSKLFR